MSARRIPVFFYGLFMDAEALRAKGIDPMNPRRASVRGFSLRIGQRATLVPDADGCAHGVLMDLTHADIDQLYADPSVSMYRPEPVSVELDGHDGVAALCFNLTAPPRPEESNAAYAEKLRELARRLGLPADYVAGIA
jgi:gamma-glutamyl AIG2-like cyclotransferase